MKQHNLSRGERDELTKKFLDKSGFIDHMFYHVSKYSPSVFFLAGAVYYSMTIFISHVAYTLFLDYTGWLRSLILILTYATSILIGSMFIEKKFGNKPLLLYHLELIEFMLFGAKNEKNNTNNS